MTSSCKPTDKGRFAADDGGGGEAAKIPPSPHKKGSHSAPIFVREDLNPSAGYRRGSRAEAPPAEDEAKRGWRSGQNHEHEYAK